MKLYDVKIPELVPEGTQGVARVKHFTVSNHDSMFTSLRAMQHPGAYVPEGNYAQLFVGRELMMSDTQMERRTNSEFVYQAHGKVLVAGLGLGLILFALADKAEVEHITIIEKYQDVIDLVGPAVKAKLGDKVTIICADILEWKPAKGTKYNTIYFDIWPNICTDNLKEMTTLHRRFAKCLDRTDLRCWMDSWQRGELKYQQARNRRHRGYW